MIIERKDQINVLTTFRTENGKIVNFLRLALEEKIITEGQQKDLINLSKRNIKR